MRRIYNRIDSLVLFQGVNHACRIINIKIVDIDIYTKQIKVDATAAKRIKYIRPYFYVDASAIIATKNNKILSLSEIKPGNRVVIDFIVLDKGQQLVKGITILK